MGKLSASDKEVEAAAKAAGCDFSYENKEILHGIDVMLPDRTTTAVIGPSGSGKTTLCNLIARFWDVDSGGVKIRGFHRIAAAGIRYGSWRGRRHTVRRRKAEDFDCQGDAEGCPYCYFG